MPRIPDAEIERIKRDTDLAALVRSRGIELLKHGGNGHLVGTCPFHEDKDPSFIVTPAKGLYHCMGCGAAGNAIQFVEKFDGVSFRHAFEILNAGSAAFRPPSDAPLKKATVPRLDLPFDPQSDDAALMRQVVDYYHERLLKTPAALDYLRGRGLYSEEAIDRFRLGFADRTLCLRLPEKNRKDGEAIRTRLQSLGLLRESGHEHFNGSIVLPVFDQDGRTMEMYGRKITPKLRKGTPLHLYLPGPHAGIWNAEALDAGDLILCEAPLDALTFWVHGFKNVTFIYGTNGFTDELFAAILARKVQCVRIAYDADEAGNKAALRDAERLAAHGVECFRVKFPHGMDANEYAAKVTPAPKSLAAALNAAQWLGGKRTIEAHGSTRPGSTRTGESPHTHAPAPSSSKEIAAISCPELSRRAANDKAAEPSETRVHPCASAVPSSSLDRVGPSTLLRAGDYHALTLGRREYRVGGLEKNNSLDVMKVTVRLRHGDLFHLDSFDLLRDGDRRRFIERAAEETTLEKELIKRDLGKLLLALEEEQTARLSAAPAAGNAPRVPELTPEERAAALELLRSPDLVGRIGDLFDACGLAGEHSNRLAAYLACTSRKLDKPLAVIIQSTSAAGKSALMEAVLSMFPPEDQVKYSAMTGQSLYYLGETNLKHRILAIVEEEGAEKASYALKLLQSEGELTIASTGKDPHTGRMETQEYHVEGPVMIFLTTTAIDIDEELQNRCLTLTVDESREQTERIHTLQRQARTLEGLRLKKQKQGLLALLRNAQRLLEPVDVVNPWADQLTFTTDRTRTRRDHEKYLTLIDAIALLHQHQRERQTLKAEMLKAENGAPESGRYITVTLDDIALANQLAPDLLGRSLDELPPQTRLLLGCIKDVVRGICKREEIEQHLALFSRRELCACSGWTYSQVKRHLIRLQELEYVAPRYGRMGTAMRYELLIGIDEPTDAQHIGLLDVAKLKTTTKTRTGKTGTWTPPCQNQMARLAVDESTTNANLATLPARTSGALAVALS
jgi:DNA primase